MWLGVDMEYGLGRHEIWLREIWDMLGETQSIAWGRCDSGETCGVTWGEV